MPENQSRMGVEGAGVSGRVGAWRATDGGLVDVDDLVDEFQAVDGVVFAGPDPGPVKAARQVAV